MAAVYYYSARSTEGAVVRGAVEAADEPAAIAMLRTRALFVTSLAREGSVAGVAAIRGRAGRDALVAFFRAFATMIGAGLPMNRALQAAIAQTRDQNLAEALRAVHDDISAGATLGDALARRPKEFTAFAIAMIRAGESAGLLDAALERLAESMEMRRAFHKRLGAALVYPLFLTFAAVLLVVFLMTSIVPMFASLYSQLHVRLPWETAGLLKIASVISGCKGVLAAGALGAVAVVATLQLRHGTAIRENVSERALGLPIVGNILRKSALAQLARNLGILLRSGVDMLSALDIVSGVVQLPAYQKNLGEMRSALAEGGSFCATAARSSLYDAMFVQMIGIGEESGALDSMLLRIAAYYEVDVEAAVSALNAMLEPLMMLALGTLIALIVFAIFIPLYTLIGNIT